MKGESMQDRIEKCIQNVEVAGASGVILQSTARRFTDFLNNAMRLVIDSSKRL